MSHTSAPIKLSGLDLQTIINTVTEAGHQLEARALLRHGDQIKLKNGTVIIRYDNGTVVVQGKNALEIVPLLRGKADEIANRASKNSSQVGHAKGSGHNKVNQATPRK